MGFVLVTDHPTLAAQEGFATREQQLEPKDHPRGTRLRTEKDDRRPREGVEFLREELFLRLERTKDPYGDGSGLFGHDGSITESADYCSTQ